jgi:hypothetical protein
MTTSFSNPRLRDDTTSGTGDYRLSKLPESTPSSLCDTLDVGYRSASDLKVQLRDRRQKTHMLKLDERTTERARTAPTQALEQLADYGFAWRDIARVVGVSVPAITKWRKGAGVTGENRLKIARLLALIDMLSERFIDEPASWLEMPITEGVGLKGMDLLERGRYDLVLDLASKHTGDGTTEYVLNEIDSNWRDNFVDNAFESFVADDGVVSLRLKG